MRISNKMIADQTANYISQNMERYNDLIVKSSSQKQFQNVSDNPAQAAASMTIKSSIQSGEGYKATAQNVSSWMDITDSAFSKMSSTLIKAITQVQSGLTDTTSADERANSMAPALDTMVDEVMDLANSTYMNQYIFSGYQINTKPYALSTANPDTVVYSGDAGQMQQDIGTGQSVTMNINNSTVITGVFNSLIRARNALKNNDMTELNASLTDLNTSLSNVGDLSSTNGARQRQVDTMIDHLDKSNLTLKSLLSTKEDANMAEVAVMLTNQQTTLQTVLEVGTRAISALNLFDYLK
jgi:flagellar hook-associated protein 3 FlgL